jgi:hypothetical protein
MSIIDARQRRLLVAACVLLAWLAACAPGQSARPVATLVPFDGSTPTSCVQQEVLPKITEVQPGRITPASEISLIATGGYIKDSCGGFNESARSYPVFLDDELVGELQCYVNHCEAKFRLPDRAGVGRHCLGVQKGSCQMELNVVAD